VLAVDGPIHLPSGIFVECLDWFIAAAEECFVHAHPLR